MDIKIAGFTHGVIVCGQADSTFRVALDDQLGGTGEIKIVGLLPASQGHRTGNTAAHRGSGRNVTLQVIGLVDADDVIHQWAHIILKQ